MNLLQGTLDLIVLKALEDGPRHGYEIAHWVRSRTEGALQVEDGALYAALHRMLGRRWLRSEWGLSDKGKRARYYALTAAGRKRLVVEMRQWTDYVDAMTRAVGESGAG